MTAARHPAPAQREDAAEEAAAHQAAALAVDRVSKAYGARKALDEVSLTVRQGEFVALLGPNGAGKTTLFQLLTGLFVSDAGEVCVRGHDMARAPVRALGAIGIVFQDPTVDRDLTVAANLRFHCRLHGIGPAQTKRRIAELLARLDVADRLDEPVRSLSGGNRRRVELARALLHEPQVLLMDEASVGLDPASRRQIVDDTLALSRERALGVLWATHLVDEAERADRVLVLHQGRLLADDTPAGLVAAHGRPDLYETFLALTGGKD